MKIALIGNPNCGKTTIFNFLTGANQRVGNWAGVTVDKKSGFITNESNEKVEIIDLPGIYSLTSSDKSSLDEKIACEFIIKENPDAILNVIDASNLERNLYLTMQLLEFNIPVILAINMVDVSTKNGLYIRYNELEKVLNCKVIPIIASKKIGIDKLKESLFKKDNYKKSNFIHQNEVIEIVKNLDDFIKTNNLEKEKYFNSKEKNLWLDLKILEQDYYVKENILSKEYKSKLEEMPKESFVANISILRYEKISKILDKVRFYEKKVKQNFLTEKIDAIALNRFLGLPFFLFIMYLMFQFSISIGGALQPFFDIVSRVIFIDGFSYILNLVGIPVWVNAIITQGAGLGINTVATFIPQIACMFLFLSFLEDSGYMSRAAFVMDKFMQKIGLPGKSFVPLIVGFGCNVPAIMATRILETRRDRLLTILMSPFISCGARLAIFAVFAASFFPQNGALIIFILYLCGILGAIITGLVVKNTLLKGKNSPFIMEIPIYHLPNFKTMSLLTWNRTKGFILKAGKLIVPVCLIIGTLNSIQIDGTINKNQDGSDSSLLSYAGKTITPVLYPIGIEEDNWQASVGLLTGILAKEVVVGTLNTLYSDKYNKMNHIKSDENNSENTFNFWEELKPAFTETYDGLKSLFSIGFLINPVDANRADADINKTAMGELSHSFSSLASVFSYLLFILLYVPCVATIGAMARESGKGWTWLGVIWSTSLAYCAAVIIYQSLTIYVNPLSSLSWIFGMIFYLGLLIYIMEIIARKISFRAGDMQGCNTSCSQKSNL